MRPDRIYVGNQIAGHTQVFAQGRQGVGSPSAHRVISASIGARREQGHGLSMRVEHRMGVGPVEGAALQPREALPQVSLIRVEVGGQRHIPIPRQTPELVVRLAMVAFHLLCELDYRRVGGAVLRQAAQSYLCHSISCRGIHKLPGGTGDLRIYSAAAKWFIR